MQWHRSLGSSPSAPSLPFQRALVIDRHWSLSACLPPMPLLRGPFGGAHLLRLCIIDSQLQHPIVGSSPDTLKIDYSSPTQPIDSTSWQTEYQISQGRCPRPSTTTRKLRHPVKALAIAHTTLVDNSQMNARSPRSSESSRRSRWVR